MSDLYNGIHFIWDVFGIALFASMAIALVIANIAMAANYYTDRRNKK